MPSPFYNTGARYGIRALLGTTNISDIDVGMQAMRDDVENKVTGYVSGTHAARLAATALDGLLWRETNAPFLVYLGNGTTWLPVMIPGPWTALTLGTGITSPANISSNIAAARVVGDEVELRGGLTNTSGAPITALATVPAACIPLELAEMGFVTSGFSQLLVYGLSGGGFSAGAMRATNVPSGASVCFEGFGYSLT